MKNFLMCALILCAIPAVAFGQTVTCDDCTHDVSVYMGSGGLIAETDADEVVFVATCGGVTTSGKLMPNDDGMVATLFDDDNGLACHSAHEGNRMQLGPVMDGGWFWINDEMSSAVGNLVNHKIMDNEMTDIADAGDGVTSMMGKGAVFLKETKSGRVGILPTILPVETPDPATRCGYSDRGAAWGAARYVPVKSECMLGDGKTVIRTLGPGSAGTDTQIMTGVVVRPYVGTRTVKFDLWGNGTGHYSTSAADARLGHPGGGAIPATFTGEIAGAGAIADADLPAAGVSADTGMTTEVQGAFTIEPDEAYCGTSTKPKAHSATLSVTATVDANQSPDVVPAVADVAPGPAVAAAYAKLAIVCPASSAANQGTELVPENPFPTTE